MQDIDGKRYAAGSLRQWATASLGWPLAAVLVLVTGAVPCALHAQTVAPSSAPLVQRAQSQRAQEKDEALQASQQAPRVGLPSAESVHAWGNTALPTETPCFVLHHLTLRGPHVGQFGFAQRYLDRYVGRCVGEQGLRTITARLTDRILSAGYVTSQVRLPAQSLRSGQLEFILIAGTVEGFRAAAGSAPMHWRNAFPLRPGDVLNLRALEQGLEQMQRVSSQDVHMAIQPGDRPGTSIVVVNVQASKPWHITMSFNDNGVDSTGRNQGAVSLVLDQPLHMNDMLSLSAGHSLERNGGRFGSGNGSLDEQIPWGWWNADLYASRYAFYQQLIGGGQAFRSSGTSENFGVRLSRVLHRTAHGRTTVQSSLDARDAHNFIDGTEIPIQHRQTRSASVGVAQREYVGAAQWDGTLTYQHGVPWFGGQWDPDTPGALIPHFDYHAWLADVGVQWPTHWGQQPLLINSALHAQYSPDRLYAEDEIGIGGLYTVRGFNGDASLSADNGYYWRNQLNLPLRGSRIQLYTGLDYGRVWGPDFPYVSGHVLSGAFVGYQDALGSHVQWNLSLAWPMVRPAWMPGHGPVAQAAVSVLL